MPARSTIERNRAQACACTFAAIPSRSTMIDVMTVLPIDGHAAILVKLEIPVSDMWSSAMSARSTSVPPGSMKPSGAQAREQATDS